MGSYVIVFENCQLTDGKKHGDKWYPFNGVTNYGSVWRKGAENRGLECGYIYNYTWLYSRGFINCENTIPIRVAKSKTHTVLLILFVWKIRKGKKTTSEY